jgi:ketosteroid isomerase-like protein
MKGVLISMVVCALLSGTARGEECRGSVTEAEALAAEDARYAAQMGADVAALEKLLADDLVYTHSNAAVDDKKAFIEALRSGATKYRTMKRSDTRTRTYGCVAILTGRADFQTTTKGQDSAVALRFHAIWVKRPAGLQFISWQSTRLPAAP